MYIHSFYTKSKTSFVGLLLLFFFIDEVAFILYNISFFQFMCATTFSLFFTDEIPAYSILYLLDVSNAFHIDQYSCLSVNYYSVFFIDAYSLDMFFNYKSVSSDMSSVVNNIYIIDEATTYYKIKLEATNVKKHVMSFYPLQQYIYTIPGESSLIFYRLENKVNCDFHTLSVYVTTPAEAVAYIKKLQCFCYEELLVAPYSIIDLPILFSIDEEILNEEFKEITINYILLLK